MIKIVNGEEVEMTDDEVKAREAEEAAWAARRIPTSDEIDQDALNKALAEPGSIVRAMADVMMAEINKLRVKGGDAAYTKAQFVAALKGKMR